MNKKKIKSRIDKLEWFILLSIIVLIDLFGLALCFNIDTINIIYVVTMVFINMFILWMFMDDRYE